ncbi:MAG: CDP-glycerol glycerophosphotransferase family protein, partial [Peptostreptococcaceae bacterium]
NTRSIDEYKAKFKKNSQTWDYLLAQNQYSADIFKRAFYFDKEILTYGYPANSILYSKNNDIEINKLKDKFNLPKDKKIILYSPTWRDNNFFQKGHYKMSLQLDLDYLFDNISDDYIVILRLHYLISNSIDISKYEGFVYDFSGAYDIQELYLVSDLNITDYSSTMFDYANLKRPQLFFAYDLENYRDSLRGFYFELEEEAPGPIVKTNEEIAYWLNNIDNLNREYSDKINTFYDKFCYIDKEILTKNIIDKIIDNN